MIGAPAPLLYEVPIRPWLASLSDRYRRRITLGDVPDAEIEALAAAGFDYLWPMGVWRTGPEATRFARDQPWLEERWAAAFRDGRPAEIVASPFAVAEYVADDAFGGEAGLARLRERLTRAGLGLILDVVAHHTGIDAPWLREHPDWYVAGGDAHRAADPDGYSDIAVPGQARWIAHCRDPHFPPWTDAAPLDYRHPVVHEAMTGVLRSLAKRCDGVRADMAMLTLSDVFAATWTGRSLPPLEGGAGGEFWSAGIAAVRRESPGFVFIAEAYWDLGWRLQQLGFDYTYDKTFRDRLTAGDGLGLVAHLHADEEFQRRSVRFLENHDEERTAAVLPLERHRSAAVLAASVPGMFLVHDGQLGGARFRSPVQFARTPGEPVDEAIRELYAGLFGALAGSQLRRGAPLRLEPEPAWPGNPTHQAFVAHLWSGSRERSHLAAVNIGGTAGQCRLRIPFPSATGRSIRLIDLLGPARYERDVSELRDLGLYLELPANGVHLFRIEATDQPS